MDSPTNGRLLWIEEPCLCDSCTEMRSSLLSAYHVTRNADKQAPSYPALLKTAAYIGDALQALHEDHRPELYPLARTTNEGGEATTKPTAASHDHDQSSGKHKFLVCDHCMAHGLICDEASVCEQCRSYGQPCVHRWCAISPTSKEDCPNSKCRYAHMDSIPHVENEAKWIILRGALPPHLERGRLRSLDFSQHLDAHTDQVEWVKFLNSRQEDAVRTFNKAAEKGDGTYAKYYIACECTAK